jgi:hypothetical protein
MEVNRIRSSRYAKSPRAQKDWPQVIVKGHIGEG